MNGTTGEGHVRVRVEHDGTKIADGSARVVILPADVTTVPENPTQSRQDAKDFSGLRAFASLREVSVYDASRLRDGRFPAAVLAEHAHTLGFQFIPLHHQRLRVRHVIFPFSWLILSALGRLEAFRRGVLRGG